MRDRTGRIKRIEKAFKYVGHAPVMIVTGEELRIKGREAIKCDVLIINDIPDYWAGDHAAACKELGFEPAIDMIQL